MTQALGLLQGHTGFRMVHGHTGFENWYRVTQALGSGTWSHRLWELV